MSKIAINERFINSVNFIISEKKDENKGTIAEKLNIKKAKFSEILNERMNVGIDEILLFSEKFNYRIEWLLTGKGEKYIEENLQKENVLQTTDITTEIYKTTPLDKKNIPFVSVTAIGGFGNKNFAIQENDIKEYYVIPKFKHKKIDFMIEVEGSSMYPKYNSGDVVACTIIKESSFIQWNKAHVIATREQGIIIKRLKKSETENSLIMISDNPSYEPFEVSKKDILGIALVVGVIRLE